MIKVEVDFIVILSKKLRRKQSTTTLEFAFAWYIIDVIKISAKFVQAIL